MRQAIRRLGAVAVLVLAIAATQTAYAQSLDAKPTACRPVPGIPKTFTCDRGFICREDQCVPVVFAGQRLLLTEPVIEAPVITDPELYAHGRVLRNAGVTLTLVAALFDAAGIGLLAYYNSLPPPGPRDCWCRDIGYAWGGLGLLGLSVPFLGAGIPLWVHGEHVMASAQSTPTAGRLLPYVSPTSGGLVAGVRVGSF